MAAFAFKLLQQEIRAARIRASRAHEDAELRVTRAEEHLADVRRRLDEWTETQDHGVRQTADGMVRLRHSGPPLPRMVNLVVGEAVQNLRTALDYLVYGLTWLDSGAHREQTQFPIVDREETFAARRRDRLGGLSDEHAEMIRALQPFAGCSWTASLRDTSNQDKHWALKVTIAQGSVVATNIGQPDFDVQLESRLAFEDDTLVFEWLEDLISRVRGVLSEFRPDFDRPVVFEFGGLRHVIQKQGHGAHPTTANPVRDTN